MMLLYNLGIWIFGGVVRIAAPIKPKARLRTEGLKDIFARMRQAIPPEADVIWVHAASLGEFEQGRPVIEALRKSRPDHKILLTFFSPSGYEVRKNYPGADWVWYLPVDTPRNARRFVQIARPRIAVFIKYEFWLNYLRRLSKTGCRTLLISAIFNPDQIFFKWYGGIFRRGLRRFEHLFVQNEESRGLLKGIGIGGVTVTGDTRFDRVAAVAAAARELSEIARFTAGARTLVAGSTWPPDEHIMMEMIRLHPQFKFVVVPHEIVPERIERFVAQSPLPAVRYTQSGPGDEQARVMVVDTVGILSSLYRYGSYAYVGGGFGAGIHNTLEAAAFGLPIAFGPNYHRFREACELIEQGAAVPIESSDDLNEWIVRLEEDRAAYDEACAASREYIARNEGATARIVAYIG